MSFTPNEIKAKEENADRVENNIHKALYKPLEVCKKELLPWACFSTTAKSLSGIERVLDVLHCRGKPALAESIEKAYHELLIFATASDQRCNLNSLEVPKSAGSTLKACKDLLKRTENQNGFNVVKIEMRKYLEIQSKLFASKLRHIAEVVKIPAGKGEGGKLDKKEKPGPKPKYTAEKAKNIYASYEKYLKDNKGIKYAWLQAAKEHRITGRNKKPSGKAAEQACRRYLEQNK